MPSSTTGLLRAAVLAASLIGLAGCGAVTTDPATPPAQPPVSAEQKLAAWNGRWTPTAAILDDPAMQPAWEAIAAIAPGWTASSARDAMMAIARVDFAEMEVDAPLVTLRGDTGRTLCAAIFTPTAGSSDAPAQDHGNAEHGHAESDDAEHGHAVPPAQHFGLAETRTGDCTNFQRLELRPPNGTDGWDQHFHIRYGNAGQMADGPQWNPSLRQAPVDAERFAQLALRDAAKFAQHLPARHARQTHTRPARPH
jgi:hypothetical protein